MIQQINLLERMKTMSDSMDNKLTRKICNHIKMRETHNKTDNLRSNSMGSATNAIKKTFKRLMMKAKMH